MIFHMVFMICYIYCIFQILQQPKDLDFSEIVVDIDCHPTKDVIAVGTIEGQVILYVKAEAVHCIHTEGQTH